MFLKVTGCADIDRIFLVDDTTQLQILARKVRIQDLAIQRLAFS